LALFIRQCVPAGMSLLDTLHYVNSLGGICIAAHPKTRFAHSPSRNSIDNALRHPIGKKTLVEIEVYNARLFRKDSNKAAMRIAQENDVSLVADSDAHVARILVKVQPDLKETLPGSYARPWKAIRHTSFITKK